jgi:hypothetical protein
MDNLEDNDFITTEEAHQISRMTNKLKSYVPKNEVHRDYYEGKNKIQNLEIAIPKMMEGLNIAIGWGRMIIDALVKRTLLEMIKDGNGSWLEHIWTANRMKLKHQQNTKQSYIYGTSYILIGAGDAAQLEPKTLLTVESVFTTVGEVGRSGELTALLKVVYDKNGNPERGSLYKPGEVINFLYKSGSKAQSNDFNTMNNVVGLVPYTLTGRYKTLIPFVPAEHFPNNPLGSDNTGESELTPSIISTINSAVRTLAQGEFSKEIYSHPQRAFLDVDSETAQAIYDNGVPTPVDGVIVMKRQETQGNKLDGQTYAPTPQIVQLDAASPAPFIEWLKAFAQIIAGETGIPVSRLGYSSEGNPQSAEAIRASEVELVRNANLRRDVFDASYQRLAVKLFFIEFGRFPEPGELDYISQWVRPDVQTPAADVDAALKMSQINPSMPGADIILSKAGLTAEEVVGIMQQTEDTAKVLAGDIATVAQHARQNNPILEQLAQLNADPDFEGDEEA